MLEVRRREFISLLGGAAAAWPLVARGQSPGKIPRVGYLTSSTEDDSEGQARNAAFRQALEKLGWADGHNIHIDHRWDAAQERVRASAAEIVSLAPNVILAEGSPLSEALRRESRTIPIVFVAVSDPLESGLVENMAHPGGNLTGFANYLFSMGGKWLETLKEVAPGIKRVLVILGPRNIGQRGFLKAIEVAAAALGVQVVAAAVPDGLEIERAVNALVQEPNGALLVLPGNPGRDNSDSIIALASTHRLPAVYPYRSSAKSGGLISYDTEIIDLFRRAAFYVDRILRGEKAGDLPVQLPTKYDFVINLRTARTLGLETPTTLLARADEVIE